MFSDRRATFRSDDTVEREANLVRRWGNTWNRSKFNIVDLIKGPLSNNLPFHLEINFEDARLKKSEAFVTFSRYSDQATLCVRESIWRLAQANHDRSRFILAHEIGHLKMHRHDALGFSALGESILSKIQEEDRAEPQANKFADRLLIPESMVVGFNAADEISYMFDVPIDCAQRRLDLVQDRDRRRQARQMGDPCPFCLNFTLVRNGTYLKCDTCGSTTACS